jgi:hypothetical protein
MELLRLLEGSLGGFDISDLSLSAGDKFSAEGGWNPLSLVHSGVLCRGPTN